MFNIKQTAVEDITSGKDNSHLKIILLSYLTLIMNYDKYLFISIYIDKCIWKVDYVQLYNMHCFNSAIIR